MRSIPVSARVSFVMRALCSAAGFLSLAAGASSTIEPSEAPGALASTPEHPACFCLYQDSREPEAVIQDFKSRCSDTRWVTYQYLTAKKCEDTRILPLSRAAEIREAKGASLVVAYVGNRYALAFPQLVQLCLANCPAGACKGGLCARDLACGSKDDVANVEGDAKTLAKVVKKFGKAELTSNQTMGCSQHESYQTPVALKVFAATADGNPTVAADTSATLINCHPAGWYCDASADHVHGADFVNHWACLGADGNSATQYCCGSTFKNNRLGHWNAPGVVCESPAPSPTASP